MWEPAQSIADSEVADMSCHAGAADFFWKPEAAGSRASREVMSTSVHVRCRSWLATESLSECVIGRIKHYCRADVVGSCS